MIAALTKQITRIEAEIKETLKSNSDLQKNYDLLLSIKGVGPVLATYMLVYTDNFTKFDGARQFACYAGIAPFPYRSGSSIRGRTKVSQLGFRKIKSILHLAACIAIQFNPELRSYYQRRLAEGKSKMSSLNIVRNKLVFRVFAVIKDQRPYEPECPPLKIAA
jgi:transposase